MKLFPADFSLSSAPIARYGARHCSAGNRPDAKPATRNIDMSLSKKWISVLALSVAQLCQPAIAKIGPIESSPQPTQQAAPSIVSLEQTDCLQNALPTGEVLRAIHLSSGQNPSPADAEFFVSNSKRLVAYRLQGKERGLYNADFNATTNTMTLSPTPPEATTNATLEKMLQCLSPALGSANN